MVFEVIPCPDCRGSDVVKNGKTPDSKQHFLFQIQDCNRGTFILILNYSSIKYSKRKLSGILQELPA